MKMIQMRTLSFEQKIKDHVSGKITSPDIVDFMMDRSCNLKCPSCRLDMIIADSEKPKGLGITSAFFDKL